MLFAAQVCNIRKYFSLI